MKNLASLLTVRNFTRVALLSAAAIVVASCGSKATPEDEVRNYSAYMVEKLSANQIDSIKTAYPDIVLADSIAPLQSDTIIVVETTPGQFDVTLAEGITLKMSRDEDGNIAVTESKGLFAFPADKKDIAQKTGMWDDSLNDAQMSERMKNDDFFAYIAATKTVQPSKIISIGRFKNNGNGTGYYPITNNTDMAIAGNDYEFVIVTSVPVFEGRAVDYWDTKTGTEPGKDLEPNVTTQVTSQVNETFFAGEVGPAKEIKSVKFKIPDNELKAKFVKYNGNEFQEYLSQKGN